MNDLISKIEHNNETIGIIGLGYVGLPLAVCFAESNINVIGFDKSESKVNKINNGENYINDIRDASLRLLVRLDNTSITAGMYGINSNRKSRTRHAKSLYTTCINN